MSGEAKFIITLVILTIIGSIIYFLQDPDLREKFIYKVLGLPQPKLADIGHEKVFRQSDVFFQIIQDEKMEIDRRITTYQRLVKALDKEKEDLQMIRDSIKQYKEEIAEYYKNKKKEFAQFDVSIAKIYENMDSAIAADVLSKIKNKDIVVQVLINMDPEKSAKILGSMDAKLASDLSYLMANRDKTREVLPNE